VHKTSKIWTSPTNTCKTHLLMAQYLLSLIHYVCKTHLLMAQYLLFLIHYACTHVYLEEIPYDTCSMYFAWWQVHLVTKHCLDGTLQITSKKNSVLMTYWSQWLQQLFCSHCCPKWLQQWLLQSLWTSHLGHGCLLVNLD